MTETLEIIQPASENSYKKYFPIVTAICCLTCIFLFAGINMEGKTDDLENYKNWGAPSLIEIFNGSYWGLITSNFLHIELWHIAFNLYWFWIFGKKIEFESNKSFYILLILSSALASSLSELSFSKETGIGLSGIGYSFFGFIYIKSKTTEAYKNFLDQRTIVLFVFWLFLCVFLTHTEIWNVGNAAHIGGLLWGMTLAYISRFVHFKQWLIGFILLSVLASSIFWSPFSTSWLSYQAFELHSNQKFGDAIIVYKKILRRDPDNKFASENLKQLEVENLQEKAGELHKTQKVDEAIIVYREILIRDPGNEFAKENLKQLEVYKLQEKAVELHKKLKYKEAREVYIQILSMDKDNQWAKDNLKILPIE